MKRSVGILLVLGLILAAAAPAFAGEMKFSGFYRMIGYAEEKKVNGDEGVSQQFIDQRFRARLDYAINDNVSVTYFAEVDSPWGETGRALTGGGLGGVSIIGDGGADGVNVETKNVFVNLKSGDTSAAIGIQTFADKFEGVIALDDMAAIAVNHKMGATSLRAVYSKWDEGNRLTAFTGDRAAWDDIDFYVVDLSQKFSDTFTAGASIYWLDDNTDEGAADDRNVYFYGLNADAKLGDLGISGFVLMQDGEDDTNDVDYEGWAATVKATQKIGNGDVGLRVIYFSDGNDDAWKGFKGQYEFSKENQMQMLVDPFVCNDTKERYGLTSAALGDGLLGAVLSGNHKLADDMYTKWGLGYYTALDDKNAAGDGEDLGYEVALRLGKQYFDKKVDVSLNGSWADYGDYFDDADGTYKTYLMVQVPF